MNEWLLSEWGKKFAKRWIVAVVSTAGAKALCEQYGITIDVDTFAAAAVTVLWGAVDLLRNWAKVKYNLKFL